jgi:hypothetical protein
MLVFKTKHESQEAKIHIFAEIKYTCMLNATITKLKKELSIRNKDELIALCLNLAKLKKDSKEFLNYLLFESENEQLYIAGVKEDINAQFEAINTSNYHFMKKGLRKVLRNTKKYIRYSKKKETEVALLLHFCDLMQTIKPSIHKNNVLFNLFERTLLTVEKAIEKLHEDLQYDYSKELKKLRLEN